jgi:hypothetical protein
MSVAARLQDFRLCYRALDAEARTSEAIVANMRAGNGYRPEIIAKRQVVAERLRQAAEFAHAALLVLEGTKE